MILGYYWLPHSIEMRTNRDLNDPSLKMTSVPLKLLAIEKGMAPRFAVGGHQAEPLATRSQKDQGVLDMLGTETHRPKGFHASGYV